MKNTQPVPENRSQPGTRHHNPRRLYVLLGLLILVMLPVPVRAQSAPVKISRTMPDDSDVYTQYGSDPMQTEGQVRIRGVATSPALPHLIFIALKRDFEHVSDEWLPPQYSEDGGETWEEVATTPWMIPGIDGMSIAVVPRTDGSPRFVVSVSMQPEPSEEPYEYSVVTYRTGDMGVAWAEQEIVEEGRIGYISASAANPSRLYLAYRYLSWDGGEWWSEAMTSGDAGIVWEPLCGAASSSDFLSIKPSPVLPNRVYFGSRFNDWYRSDDAGNTCTFMSSQDVMPSVLDLDAADETRLYGLDPAETSDDGGITWSLWSEYPSEYGQLFAHPTKTQTVFLLHEGLFRSDDAGASWHQTSEIEGGWLEADYSTAGRIFWVNDACLWASSDDGVSWEALIAGCTRVSVFLPFVNLHTAEPDHLASR